MTDPEEIVADASYAIDDSAQVGARKKCERCGTELELAQPFGAGSRMMWAEAGRLPNMCMVHVQSRCDVIADGGDPGYKPPAPPRPPQCKARRTQWQDSREEWVTTYACSRDLDHPAGMHSNGMAWWTDDQSDPPGFRPEDLPRTERREEDRAER
jgi:hypothetical protein